MKELLNKTAQAITGNLDLHLHFSNHFSSNFFSWNQSCLLDGLKTYYPNDIQQNNRQKKYQLALAKANADLICCYILFHNNAIHHNFCKQKDETWQYIFDDFEKMRLILLATENYLGMASNIIFALQQQLDQATKNNIALILLHDMLGDAVLTMSLELGSDLVNKIIKLKASIYNQGEFAQQVAFIIDLISTKNEQKQHHNQKQDDAKLENEQKQDEQQQFDQQQLQTKGEQQEDEASQQENNKTESPAEIEQASNANQIWQQGDSATNSSTNEDKIIFDRPYKIFNNQFDEIVYPQKFISKQELENLHKQFKVKTAYMQNVSQKISLKFKRKLLARQNNILEYKNEGTLNRKKLMQIVAKPSCEDIWLKQKNHDYQNTTITLLLDNSGSMRGNPIITSAIACKTIATILEKFAVKTEIIGFTTADWKGGRVRKIWEMSGRVANPGRLNQLRHIIYKHNKQSFKKSEINLALMLKEGLLKENIDGEAILFARSRLMQQNENRKILVVISDGNPVDDSTQTANDGDILNWHLEKVINNIQKQNKIELIGIGIGHDVSRFYQNYIVINDASELGNVLIEKISQVL
jgi:cobaltochelatase CobT